MTVAILMLQLPLSAFEATTVLRRRPSLTRARIAAAWLVPAEPRR